MRCFAIRTCAASVLGLVLGAGCVFPGGGWHGLEPIPEDDATLMRVHSAQIGLQDTPREASLWTDLGEAWLERGRVTLDPRAVSHAHDAFERSLALEAGDEALRGMVELALFRQRFEDVLGWCERALARRPEDERLQAARSEALRALGRVPAEGRHALPGSDEPGRERLLRELDELRTAEGSRAALLACERWLTVREDPWLEILALRLARTVGDDERAQRHFRRGELSLLRALDAHEVYTLGALAQLYQASGDDLDQAIEFARRQARVLRTTEARGLVEQLELERSRRVGEHKH